MRFVDRPTAMQSSVTVALTPRVEYLLRIADTCLIHAQRLGEWCGHGPILEEDIALSNMALDLLGAARGLYTHVGQLDGNALDEDELAFLRDERDYRNVTLAELPRGDYAVTVVRNVLLAVFLRLLWERLIDSTDSEVVGIAAKAVKEARYHVQHYSAWLARLGDGTEESARRTQAALEQQWIYVDELFMDDVADSAAAASGLGPAWSELRGPWLGEIRAMLRQAQCDQPEDSPYRSFGKFGRHSENLGYILSEMQFLQRTYPGGVW
jgi:ring-1,2-phenylacetyl-CoA epoxidase subunit PaaC